MRRSKGFFFTIEALFAFLILLVGILIIFTARPKFVFVTQATTYTDGVQNVLMTRTMEELSVPWWCPVDAPDQARELCAARYVSFPDNTVLEQVATYLFDGPPTDEDLANAQDLSRLIINGIISPTHYYNLTLEDERGIVAVAAQSVGPVRPVEGATVRFVGRRITYFRNSSGVRGPVIAALEVWR